MAISLVLCGDVKDLITHMQGEVAIETIFYTFC